MSNEMISIGHTLLRLKCLQLCETNQQATLIPLKIYQVKSSFGCGVFICMGLSITYGIAIARHQLLQTSIAE